jgi:hypothetical protein
LLLLLLLLLRLELLLLLLLLLLLQAPRIQVMLRKARTVIGALEEGHLVELPSARWRRVVQRWPLLLLLLLLLILQSRLAPLCFALP